MRGEERSGEGKRETEEGRDRWREDGKGGGKITHFSHKHIKQNSKYMKKMIKNTNNKM